MNRWETRNEKDNQTKRERKSFAGRRNGECKGPEAGNPTERSPLWLEGEDRGQVA